MHSVKSQRVEISIGYFNAASLLQFPDLNKMSPSLRRPSASHADTLRKALVQSQRSLATVYVSIARNKFLNTIDPDADNTSFDVAQQVYHPAV